MPHFITTDSSGNKAGIEAIAGKPSLLIFLSFANKRANFEFIEELRLLLKQQEKLDCTIIFITDADYDVIDYWKKAAKINFIFWSDSDKKIARAIGANSFPYVLLLGKNLQIKKIYNAANSSSNNTASLSIADLAVADLADLLKNYNSQAADSVAASAPTLIIPKVLSDDFCEHLIAVFNSSEIFNGAVGAEGIYSPTAKKRSDLIISKELRLIIDKKLSRNLFPEIEKIYGFKVAGRENYKIGLYSGENQGFFKPHRDNYIKETAYRRIAMTINLSDNYQGGGLRFPEYDNRVYKPSRGSIIAFPAGIMHEALPVTSGERFILLGFFHGKEEENLRRQYAHKKGEELLADEFSIEQNIAGNDIL